MYIAYVLLRKACVMTSSSDQIWRLLKTKGGRIVCLRDGSGVPVFLIHGAGGDINGFPQIAEQIEASNPVYGIQARASDMENDVDKTIEQLGALYATLIGQASASATIVVGGYSSGAVLALEVAHNLQRMRRQVPLLIAIDGAPYGHKPSIGRDISNLLGWVRISAMDRTSLPQATRRLDYSDLFFASRVAKRGIAPSHRAYIFSILVAMCRYVPRRFAGKALVIKCTDQSLFRSRKLVGQWKRLVDECHVISVLGRHGDVAASDRHTIRGCAHAITSSLVGLNEETQQRDEVIHDRSQNGRRTADAAEVRDMDLGCLLPFP